MTSTSAAQSGMQRLCIVHDGTNKRSSALHEAVLDSPRGPALLQSQTAGHRTYESAFVVAVPLWASRKLAARRNVCLEFQWVSICCAV